MSELADTSGTSDQNRPLLSMHGTPSGGPCGETPHTGARGSLEPLFQTTPFRAHVTGTLGRAAGGYLRGALRYPQQMWPKTIPRDALIMLRYVSWGNFVTQKSSGPLCGAGGESSLGLLDWPLWPVTRAPFPGPPRPLGARTTPPPPPPPRAQTLCCPLQGQGQGCSDNCKVLDAVCPGCLLGGSRRS